MDETENTSKDMFSPSIPNNMPDSFIAAATSVYEQRDRETQESSWRERPNASKQKGSEGSTIAQVTITKEELLYKICESKNVADAAEEITNLINICETFWELLIATAIQMREDIRTSDKRAKVVRIELLTRIKDQLKKTSDMLDQETIGYWREGMGSEKLLHENGPFDQLLLDDINTSRFSISGLESKSKNFEESSFQVRGRLSARTVARANSALAEALTKHIDTIKTNEPSFRPKAGNAGLRQCEAILDEVFEHELELTSVPVFKAAKNRLKTAIIDCVIGFAKDAKGSKPYQQVRELERGRLRDKKRN